MIFLLADHREIERRGLREILAVAFRDPQFVEARSGDELLRTVASSGASLLVLSMELPGQSGITTVREIKNRCSRLPILVMGTHPDDQFAVRYLRAGASGYLNHSCNGEELVGAIRKMLHGGRYITSELTDRLIFEAVGPIPENPHETLSDRELEVLRWIAIGKSLTSIAKILCLSVKTVSTYRSRGLLKMNLFSNAELTRYALEHKLIV